MWRIPATIFWVNIFGLGWMGGVAAFDSGWVGIGIVIASIGMTALLIKNLMEGEE